MKFTVIIWTISILLLLLDLYLLFADPLGRQFDLYKIVLGWVVITQLGDYSLRQNKFYNRIRGIIITAALAIFYLVFPF